MQKRVKRVPAVFYQTAAGAEPVRRWLKSLPDEDRRLVGQDIATLEFGWPVGMPLCRPLGNAGLSEIRSDLTSGRTARVIFFVYHGQMVLLHGFIKKSQQTPAADLDLAIARRKDFER